MGYYFLQLKKIIDIFYSKSNDLFKVSFKMHFINKLPKIWFEMIAVIILTFIIFFLYITQSDISNIMATIGIFLITSIRVMPSINRILTSLQNLKYSEAALDSLLIGLENSNEFISSKRIEHLNDKINFKNEIKFNNVFFNYPKSNKDVLRNISISIKKNQFIGLIGETGSGKSTLVDLMIGLLKPTRGTITVDGKNISQNLEDWRGNLGYVPQNVYLLDESIKNNIAFGGEEKDIDIERIHNSIDKFN